MGIATRLLPHLCQSWNVTGRPLSLHFYVELVALLLLVLTVYILNFSYNIFQCTPKFVERFFYIFRVCFHILPFILNYLRY